MVIYRVINLSAWALCAFLNILSTCADAVIKRDADAVNQVPTMWNQIY